MSIYIYIYIYIYIEGWASMHARSLPAHLRPWSENQSHTRRVDDFVRAAASWLAVLLGLNRVCQQAWEVALVG